MQRQILGFLVMFASCLLFHHMLKQTIVFFGEEWNTSIAWLVAIWSGMIYHWIVSPLQIVVHEIYKGK